MRYVSLFTGCGLLDLGLERAGWVPVMFCERDQHCQRVLARHWPGVPVVGDVREVAADTEHAGSSRAGIGPQPVGALDGSLDAGAAQAAGNPTVVDLVVGGFPCQPVSYAGKRQAQSDDRWLWPEMARVVRALRSRLVLVKNVPGLATAGLGEVIGDLAAAGYVGEWFRVRASDVGAPHRRERLFIVAVAADSANERRDGHVPAFAARVAGQPRHSDRPASADADDGRCEQHDEGERGVPVARTDGAQPVAWGAYEPAIRRWEQVMGAAPAPTDDRGRLAPEFVEWMMGAPAGWTDGVSRTQRLKMLGNGVQVQVGELLGHALAELTR